MEEEGGGAGMPHPLLMMPEEGGGVEDRSPAEDPVDGRMLSPQPKLSSSPLQRARRALVFSLIFLGGLGWGGGGQLFLRDNKCVLKDDFSDF